MGILLPGSDGSYWPAAVRSSIESGRLAALLGCGPWGGPKFFAADANKGNSHAGDIGGLSATGKVRSLRRANRGFFSRRKGQTVTSAVAKENLRLGRMAYRRRSIRCKSPVTHGERCAACRGEHEESVEATPHTVIASVRGRRAFGASPAQMAIGRHWGAAGRLLAPRSSNLSRTTPS
jgi:hypothetical protein